MSDANNTEVGKIDITSADITDLNAISMRIFGNIAHAKNTIDRLKKLLDEVRPFAAFPDVETAKAWHDAVTKELKD
jgi:hypothetical protein